MARSCPEFGIVSHPSISYPSLHSFILNLQSRELFCLMVEKMKSIHSDHRSKGHLTQVSIFVGTWNMGKLSIFF